MAEYCYHHKGVETLLHCGNCGRPICVRCTVQHPVGIRCPECARSKPIAAFEVSSLQYTRAIAAALGIGAAGVFALLLAGDLLSLLPLGLAGYYIRWLVLIGVGYLIGRGVRLAAGNKRGQGLQWLAGVTLAVVFLAAASLAGLALDSFAAILALLAAVYVAVIQLRV